MRFTSLIVELVRARPRLIFWIVVLAQAALWLFLPWLLYGSPPGDVAAVLAFGREHQVGTTLGPPAAFWLADIAFPPVRQSHLRRLPVVAALLCGDVLGVVQAQPRHCRRAAGGSCRAVDGHRHALLLSRD